MDGVLLGTNDWVRSKEGPLDGSCEGAEVSIPARSSADMDGVLVWI